MITIKNNPGSETNEGLSDKIIARFYDFVMDGVEQRSLTSRRKQLLKNIESPILEIGFGTGVNFPHYPPGSRVFAIDPSKSMSERAIHRSVNPDTTIEIFQCGIEELDQFHDLDTQFQGILFTLVLCTIPDPHQALLQVAKRLKKGGSLYILEHVQSDNRLELLLQNLLTPLWKSIAGGCHLNRSTTEVIKEAGFTAVRESRFHYYLPFVMGEYRLLPG